MPSNKKHHYVPRFYLKRFSLDGNSINIWNIKNEKRISSANLKNQCYKDYFYGKELEVEKALGLVEGQTAGIFNLVDRYGFPPPYGSKEYFTLILYVLMQYGRTTYSADAIDEMNDKLMKHLFRERAKAEGIDIDVFTIGIKDSVRFSLGITAQLYPLMLDMDCKLLINRTKIDFVTSDNPVVLYNQLFSFRKNGSNTGLANKGLQIFLPISSRMLLVFYDCESYSVGRRSMPTFEVNLPHDVYQLNTLQMTSAYANVYFENSQFDVETLFHKSKRFRRIQKSNLSVFPREETETIKKELVVSSRKDVITNLNLSFIKITKSTRQWRDRFRKQRIQPVSVVRNEKLIHEFNEFREAVDKGHFSHGDFLHFIKEKVDSMG